MEVVFRLGSASAAQVHQEIENPPTYSSVRKVLTILEEKGHLTHSLDGAKYVYRPAEDPSSVAQAAVSNLLNTFFDGSLSSMVATFIGDDGCGLNNQELEHLEQLIEQARRQGQ